MSPIRKKELRQINSFFKSLKAQKVETLKEKFAADPDGYEEDVESVEAQVHVFRQLGIRAGFSLEQLLDGRHDSFAKRIGEVSVYPRHRQSKDNQAHVFSGNFVCITLPSKF